MTPEENDALHAQFVHKLEATIRLLASQGGTDNEIEGYLDPPGRSVTPWRVLTFAERRHLEAILFGLREHWREVVVAYRVCHEKHPGDLPTQVDVAGEMGLSEQAIRNRLRAVGVAAWPDVHARIAREPAP